MAASRWTLSFLAVAWSGSSLAMGLGPLELESALGQPLRAKIPILSYAPNDIAPQCIRAKIESLDGAQIAMAKVSFSGSGSSLVLNVASVELVNEPAVSLLINLECGGRVQRSYDVLLDMPTFAVAEMAVQPTKVESTKLPVGSKVASVPVGRTIASPNTNPQKASEPAKEKRLGGTVTADRVSDGKSTQPSLKLSLLEPTASAGMKMSDRLTLSGTEEQVALQPSDEMRVARSQFAALLRNEDPALVAALHAEKIAKQLKTLEIEKVALLQDQKSSQVAYSNLSRGSYSVFWIAGLSGLLTFSIGAAGWLTFRLRAETKKKAEWWKPDDVAQDNAASSLLGKSTSAREPVFHGGTESEALRPATSDVADHDPSEKPVPVERNTLAFSPPTAGSNTLQFEAKSGDTGVFGDTVDAHGGSYGTATRHLNVEEVSDIVQEAEFWMLLNDPERALHLLEPYVDIERPNSPVTWLYLIDLYRQVGNRQKYEAISQRFKKFFNARIPAWEEDPTSVERTSLEEFPNLLERITSIWSDKAAVVPFLESLLIDDRNGERIGFDLPVYKDIILLIGVANESVRLRLP